MKLDKNFEKLWISLKIHCGWEHMPEDLAGKITPYIGIEEAKAMIRGMDVYTKSVIKKNVGNVVDERARLGITIINILSRIEIDVSPHLYEMKEWVLEYTNNIIDIILENRKNMINESEATKISKFLSLVLRHKPEEIGITMDENGWVNVNELLEKSNKRGVKFTIDHLKYIVENNSKKRFAFSDNFENIRASQGHSVEIDLGKKAVQPPDILFHGTAQKNEDKILATGILKMERQHVHLSVDIETAITVGKRHGKPIVFVVAAGKMHGKHDFFLSDNGVWLTDFVPPEFISKHEPK